LPRVYEVDRFDAKLLRNGKQVGLMCFEKAQQGRKQHRLGRSGPQLVRPDSGQGDEPLRPSSIAERCRKGGKCKSHWVIPLLANQG
jgi:hypothetical protein